MSVNTRQPRRFRGLLAGSWAVIFFAAAGCSVEEPSAQHAAEGARTDAMLVHLEARSPAGSVPSCRVSYQEKHADGESVEELEVQVDEAPGGVAHVVSIDGHELGRIVTDLDGEAKLELGGKRSFPAGFVAPAAGAVVRIGELAELRLEPLERLAHLESAVEQGKLAGKVTFKRERLAGQVTREFKLKLSGAPPGEHPVELAGVAVGDISVEADGKGKLEFSEQERTPFPADFPALEPGATVRIGALFSGRLESRLGERKGEPDR